MYEFIISLIFIIFILSIMSIGVIFSNKPIKGSCGGLQSLGLKGKCDICGETKSSNDHKKSDDIFYDASNNLN